MDIQIQRATLQDLPAILAIQRLAFQKEAMDFHDFNIEPLLQTVEELKDDPNFLAWLSTNMAQAPEGGENMMEFGTRIKAGFHEIVLEMMRRKISDAAVVTHGGVMMSLLSMCGIPTRTAAQWAVDNGKGYSVLVNASLWGDLQVFEICDKLPYGTGEVSDPKLYHFIDVPEK